MHEVLVRTTQKQWYQKKRKIYRPVKIHHLKKYDIDSYATAEQCYSAKALFINDYIITQKEALDECQPYNTDFRKEEKERYHLLANIAWKQMAIK